MKVIWLNDSIVVRASSKEEKGALALIFKSIQTEEPEDNARGEDRCEARYLSAS